MSLETSLSYSSPSFGMVDYEYTYNYDDSLWLDFYIYICFFLDFDYNS